MGVLLLSLVFVFMVMVGTEAEAGCKKLRCCGPRICADWIDGSLRCDNLIKGLPARLAKDCDPVTGENCPVFTSCEAFGTFGPFESCGQLEVPVPGETCEILGTFECRNKSGHFEENGEAFVPDPLSAFAEATLCTQGGTCINGAEVTPDPEEVCPNRNWSVDFTPSEFKGRVCVCPGGFDDFGMCCADAERTGNGNKKSCVSLFGEPPGTIGCILEFCDRNEEGEFDCVLIE
jgi:hypothetical protein